MSGQPNSKLKLLYLRDIFEKFTDEEHILNSAELVEQLKSYGIDCERKSIYKDIDILIDFGMDIIKTRTPKNGFFLASRQFEEAEVRLLCDAVQAADFISQRKSRLLLRKMERFGSEYFGQKLRGQQFIQNTKKTSNEEIYYSIDALNEAIREGKKVRVCYSRRKIDSRFAATRETKDFELSPYALVWSNDHYYLIANNAKYDNLMHLRIDRTTRVRMIDAPARPVSEVSDYETVFDSADYMNKVFNMFSGEPVKCELLFDGSIVEEIIDRFGENIALRKAKNGWVCLREEMCINDGLVSWIMQFGEKIRVASPEDLAERVRRKAEQILELYETP